MIYRLRISLADSEPEIWRLLEVRSSLTLAELHEVIQIAFGWRTSHLHAFTSPDGSRWEDPRWIEEDENGDDETEVTLGEVLDESSGPLAYEYDFGDGWEHRIELIETIDDPEAPAAFLVRGERAGPLEDSGGMRGYTEKLRILEDPQDEQHAVIRAWADGTRGPWLSSFDPDVVEVDRVNRALARRFGAGPVGWGPALTSLVSRMYPGPQVEFGQYLETAALDRPVLIEAAEAEETVRPYQWLLRRVGPTGIKLTAAGWLPPAVVSEAMRELNWEDRWFGKHNREDLTPPIASLRESAMHLGLLRRYRGSLTLTRAGRTLLDDPVGLFRHLAAHWLSRRRPQVEQDAAILLAVEIAVGVHSGQRGIDDEMDDAIAYGLGALGWADSTGYQAPAADQVWPLITEDRSMLATLGVLNGHYTAGRSRHSPLGRDFVRAALQSE